jgi:hypothetical protein
MYASTDNSTLAAEALPHHTTPRADLSIGADIRRRMAADIAAILKESTERIVTLNDLLMLGWTRGQAWRPDPRRLRRRAGRGAQSGRASSPASTGR